MNGEILAVFRIIAPQFSGFTDEEILAKIEVYHDFCSRKRFGQYWQRAVALLVAHYIALEVLSESDGDGTTGVSGGKVVGGGITSEKEGDLQRSYGSTAVSSSSDDPDALFDKTLFGKMFLQLRAMCIIPAAVRKGFDIHGYGNGQRFGF